MSAAHELNRNLARSLGLPRNTTRAVLTLEVGKLPTLEVEYLITDSFGRNVVEPIEEVSVAKRLAKANFVLRLVPSRVKHEND